MLICTAFSCVVSLAYIPNGESNIYMYCSYKQGRTIWHELYDTFFTNVQRRWGAKSGHPYNYTRICSDNIKAASLKIVNLINSSSKLVRMHVLSVGKHLEYTNPGIRVHSGAAVTWKIWP